MRLHFLFALTLAGLYLSLAQGSYEDCCLKYVHHMKPSSLRMVMSYRMQETDGGCNIPAVVLTMKKGKLICVDPKHQWVKNLIAKVQARNKKTMQRPKRLRG
ncbi:hypothetical protein DPEC_G00058720 [Dallia pectoralis]|uniref:Uncharacterized protein n=1 Tax=Dallia pectoralis TaxID=75939 RepID=A0ACC2H659_DALPE|nr:hypothetical protein DPEC_G00058720 [Dallia pectoralis]